jgi:2-iminobutanoate/2-iminopropanoate deaminase
MPQTIYTSHAPKAIGPYSQAIKTNDLIFCSGQIPLRPDGTIVEGDIKEQTKQVMENLKAVLEAANSNLDKIVKTTIYLTDLNDFQAVNEIYGSYFKQNFPARATVQVTALPKGAKIEIIATL